MIPKSGYRFSEKIMLRQKAFSKSLKAIVVSGARYPATTLSDVSMECSTRSSSWPRRTIKPVAEITL
jgi:hypothetical protein